MIREYFIPEEGLSQSDQEVRNEIADIRIAKVLDYMAYKNPALIPFKIKTPLVSFLDYSSFEKQAQKDHLFKNIPRHIQTTVRQAEKMKHFDIMFRKYLADRDISPKEYKSKNPKTKEDIFYDWLFLNKMDIDILNI